MSHKILANLPLDSTTLAPRGLWNPLDIMFIEYLHAWIFTLIYRWKRGDQKSNLSKVIQKWGSGDMLFLHDAMSQIALMAVTYRERSKYKAFGSSKQKPHSPALFSQHCVRKCTRASLLQCLLSCCCCLVTKLCPALLQTHELPPGSSVHGISQTRILEMVAISFSRGSSWPRDWTCVSYLEGEFFTTEPPGKPTVLRYSHFKHTWLSKAVNVRKGFASGRAVVYQHVGRRCDVIAGGV